MFVLTLFWTEIGLGPLFDRRNRLAKSYTTNVNLPMLQDPAAALYVYARSTVLLFVRPSVRLCVCSVFLCEFDGRSDLCGFKSVAN